MKKTRQFFSVLLTLAMLLTLVPAMGVTASAAEPEWETVNTFEELQTAVKAKKEYIKLGKDIDTKSLNSSIGMLDHDKLNFEDRNTVLDLNGKILKLQTEYNRVYSLIYLANGSLTIKNSSSVKRGEISGSFDKTAGDCAYRTIFVGENGSLTLEGGTFSADGKPYSTATEAIYCRGGSVTVKDGVTIIQRWFHNSGYAHDLDGYGYALHTEGRSKAIIDGGEFIGHVKLSGYQDANGSVQINGGTFRENVQVLYTAEENNSDPAVTVNGGTFKGHVYLQYWPWRDSLYMPYRLNGGTFYGAVDLHADKYLDKIDNPTGNPNIALGVDKCFGYNAVVTPDGTFTGSNAYTAFLKKSPPVYRDYGMWFYGRESNPARIIPNAWGIESVTLDGNPIDYAKDWKGAVERMDNSTAHTLTFKWKPLVSELAGAGYSYNATCDRYISGSATPTPDAISPTATEYSYTIPAGAAPKVYSFALHLNLKKGAGNIGIYSNEHIVKLVVNEAPVVEPDPTIEGKVYYTSGIVFGRPISIAAGVTPAEATKAYRWQRSTDGGSTWTDIDGVTGGRYTPTADDMGDTVRIRVVVTANGYLGEIVGAAVKVSKAANDSTPAPPTVAAQKDDSNAYTKFEITNFNSEQEYVYTTGAPASGNEWPTGGTEINSSTVTGLTEGNTYYIFTRHKETATHTTGSKISSSSVLIDEVTRLNRIILTDESGKVYGSYGNGNTIYIKKGESMTFTATTNPGGANTWSNFTFKSQYGVSAPFTVTAPTAPVASGSTIPGVTIHGDTVGTGTLAAEYSGYTPQSYGAWRVHVYENVRDIGTGAEITVSPTFADATMHPGETMTLPEYTVTADPEGALNDYHYEWYVREPATSPGSMGSGNNVKENTYFKVNDDGTITAKAVHTGSEDNQYKMVLLCAVKGEYDKTKLASFYVTVTEAPTIALTGLTVAPKKVNLELNATCQLSAVKEPVNAAGSLTWTSDKPAVAEVDNTGKVTAKAQGTAIITVTCGTKSASCTVTVGHTHDTDAQPWVYMDPGTHIKTCTAGDDFKVETHDFSAWTKVNDTTHSRTCSKCKKTGETANYTETANHNWQWVAVTPATPNADGKQHEECADCHAVKAGSEAVIPALTSIKVENLTVAKPVRDVAAATAATTDSTYYVESTEWKAADGTTLAIGDTFRSRTVYTVNITLKTAGTDVFSEKSAYNDIEGKTAAVTPVLTGDAHADSVILTYTFDSTGGSGGGGGGGTSRYTVSFESNGGSKVSNQSVTRNSVMKEPTAPTKENFDFAGWYSDKELKTKYDFSAKVTKSFTLYAKWTEKDNSVNQIILTIGKKDAQVFGKTKSNDVAPKIEKDRTMLPARFVAENLGAKVEWDGEKQLVTITGKNLKTDENVTILITIGAATVKVNGKEIKLDSPAFIENDRTYTPIRFISENLGASVEWVEKEQKVIITKPEIKKAETK